MLKANGEGPLLLGSPSPRAAGAANGAGAAAGLSPSSAAGPPSFAGNQWRGAAAAAGLPSSAAGKAAASDRGGVGLRQR